MSSPAATATTSVNTGWHTRLAGAVVAQATTVPLWPVLGSCEAPGRGGGSNLGGHRRPRTSNRTMGSQWPLQRSSLRLAGAWVAGGAEVAPAPTHAATVSSNAPSGRPH